MNHAVVPLAALTTLASVLAMFVQPGTARAQHQPALDDEQVRQLPTLSRMVRHFDFEEAAKSPIEMPLHFYRYGADRGGAAQGFPPFGTMKLTNEVAYSGDWSFEFSLDGGSMAARVPTAVVPVVPFADYAVAVRVRTEGLTHARARLVAWLHDARGDVIEASRVTSDLIKTNGKWETHTVEVRGQWENAADIVVELQLLQPRHFFDQHRADDDSPVLEDMRGKAWFDDLTVWNIPRVEMSTDAPGNVIATKNHTNPKLSMLVTDLARETLRARLRIFDIDGRVVHDSTFPAPRTVHKLSLRDLDYGWYRAVMELDNTDDLVARTWLDFSILAPPARSRPLRPDRRFGVVLPDHWTLQAETLRDLVRHLNIGAVVLPHWSSEPDQPHLERVQRQQQREFVRTLIADQLHLTMALDTVPAAIVEALDIAPDEVLIALAGLSKVHDSWRHEMELLLNLGVEMHQWQVNAPETAWPDLQRELDDALATLGRFVAMPRIMLQFPAEQRVSDRLRVQGRCMVIPQHVRPDAIESFAEQWADHESPFTAALEVAPAHHRGAGSQRRRIEDAFFRALHGHRTGIDTIYLPAPWSFGEDGAIAPDPTYIVWSQLAKRLDDRTFVGEMELGEAVRCWMFRGRESGDDVIVLWTDRLTPATLRMQLADHDVTSIDMFGNRANIPLTGGTLGEHTVQVTRSPMFIEDISLPLVKFRGGFALDPPFIPSEHRTHEHEIVLRNPWDMPLSGTIHVHDKAQWRITPRSHEFSIAANSETRLPLEIIFERSVLAGETTLDAQVVLEADGTYQLALSTPVTVGLHQIELAATWRIVENAETGEADIVITQYITNTGQPGTDPVHADAFVMGANIRQDRRLVANLEPGQMAIRMFHIPNGVELLAGQTVRIAVADRHGSGRLNREITIPALITSERRTVTVPDDGR